MSAIFRMLFLGPPGAGKGTYARIVNSMFNIPQVNAGDIVRDHIRSGSDIGKKMKSYNDRGELVPDDILMPLMEERIFGSPDTHFGKSFLLDGFPRNLAQAELLQDWFDKHQQHGLNLVLNLNIREDILMKKIINRRVCNSCGANFNLANIQEPENGISMPPLLPKVDGVCDFCSSPLVQRHDDTEEVVRNRMKVYREWTEPLMAFYHGLHKGRQTEFVNFDVSQGKVASTPPLISLLEKRIKYVDNL
eukprot:CAMPEP_0177666938 /NCGR_PEP_ID=MMETSP0447-20121125/21849_1 /TAXON_ID=0 /ORGANISM="Stygamoeba regulata, Strain BSH-02190019" /LENGTH=247 /DNA_ID=CAMNT_0019173121 /DNA_START=454 /DNA_END=1197 /DNA_ORIENTATION=+